MTLLGDLVCLHQVDCQVRALRGRLEAAERHLALQNRQRQELLGRIEEVKSQIRQQQASGTNHEAESGALKVRIETLRGQLNQSTNPKQYAAILNELKVLQSQRDGVDELALAQFQKAEELAGKIAELDAKLKERVGVCDAARREIETCTSEVGARLSELDRERNDASSKIPKRELDIFDRVADLYDGEAMAELVAVDVRRREYVCGACNLELPPDKYATLASNPNVVVTCTSCHRILYMPQPDAAHA
jgi:predicted  nucleic acid-binding Zn-ribbon protein